MAASGAVGAQKFPIKIQGKEFKLDHVGIDTLVAKSGVSDDCYRSFIPLFFFADLTQYACTTYLAWIMHAG